MIASLKEVQTNKQIIDEAGPSPGVFSIAAARRKLRQSPQNSVSFKRVGIKQPVYTSRGILNSKNQLKGMSVDFSDTGLIDGSQNMG